LTPISAPNIDTTTKDRRISSDTGSEIPEDREALRHSDNRKKITLSIMPHSAPHGSAAHFFFDAANPPIKYVTATLIKERGVMSLSAAVDKVQITAQINASAMEHKTDIATPKTHALIMFSFPVPFLEELEDVR
jgi:hypothetical protein